MITIAFFSNRNGAGKTTLSYHLAHMLAKMGYSVLAVDLDPQASLTSSFLDHAVLERIWDKRDFAGTVWTSVQPIVSGAAEIARIDPVAVGLGKELVLLCGDPELDQFEDRLAKAWHDRAAPLHAPLQSVFHRMIQAAGRVHESDVAIVDVGSNLGAISRAALLAADWFLIPLGPDLLSVCGLASLGPAIRDWQAEWRRMRGIAPIDWQLPAGEMRSLGYIAVDSARRNDGFDKWHRRLPEAYRSNLGGRAGDLCVATLRNYRSLIEMSREARKPMFDLAPADGAIGSHAQLVRVCEQDFRNLAEKVAEAAGLQKP